MPLTRDQLLNYKATSKITFDLDPIQLGMPTPWHVAVASIISLNSRIHRRAAVEQVLTRWPSANELAVADIDQLFRALYGVYNRRRVAAQLPRFSAEWLSPNWTNVFEIRALPVYAIDCIGIFCFHQFDPISKHPQLEAFIGVLHDFCKAESAPNLPATT